MPTEARPEPPRTPPPDPASRSHTSATSAATPARRERSPPGRSVIDVSLTVASMPTIVGSPTTVPAPPIWRISRSAEQYTQDRGGDQGGPGRELPVRLSGVPRPEDPAGHQEQDLTGEHPDVQGGPGQAREPHPQACTQFNVPQRERAWVDQPCRQQEPAVEDAAEHPPQQTLVCAGDLQGGEDRDAAGQDRIGQSVG